MQFFEARTYAPSAANRMHIRSRPAALCAKDFINLSKVHVAMEGVLQAAVIGTMTQKKARKHYLKLGMLRLSLLLPTTIFCEVNMVPRNRTIQTLQGGDDDVKSTYKVNRDQLQLLFDSLRAPLALQLSGQHTGTFSSELGFLAWLFLNGTGCTIMTLQQVFSMEYSRLNRGIHAFEDWLFQEHSFR